MFIIVTKHGSFVHTEDHLRVSAAALVGCRVYGIVTDVNSLYPTTDILPLGKTPKFGTGVEESWTTTDDEMVADAIAKS